MDSASFRDGASPEDVLDAGVKLVYLSPYPLILNPIESFSLLKAVMK